jgi:glycosyltransferase involved in cell wall biosynthesis
MKIGVDIRTLIEGRYSGVSEFNHNLIEEILKLDQKNDYKLFYNSARDLSGRLPEFNQDNVKVIRTNYPNKIFNNIMQRFFGWPKLDQLLGVDLFFLPNWGFSALSGKCKKVIVVHDLSPVLFPRYFSIKRRLWHWLINFRKVINDFDKIITVSKNTKRDVLELYGASSEKVDVIYSGLEGRYQVLPENDISLIETKSKYNLPDKFIFFLGTLEPRKNVDGLIRAYNIFRKNNEELNDYKLVIAGSRGWIYRHIFQELKKSPYRQDIQFIGYVDNDDKVALYNLADLFVFPSFYEGFGFPPLEAMACGTPTVTSFVSSMPEVVGEAALMIDPYNSQAIAKAIEAILTDEELKKDLISKGLARVKRFNWESAAKKYLDIFLELAQ